LAQSGKGAVVTWYDVLGLLPGASAEQVKQQHDAKVSLLRPALLTGAPSPAVTAATRAREILDAAQRVLADPDSRARYDAAAGIRGDGGGLVRRGGFPSEPGSRSDDGLVAGNPGAEMLGALLALSDWLAPHPGPPRRVTVPDVSGLFFSVCLGITGKLGLRVTTVRLTAHPMPVDGLVVAQSPRPATRARRGSALTVQVWHPPARSVVPGQVIR
jgi:curved DNA-binding protein CbpA